MPEDESFYMAVNEPRDFRRDLLSSNKMIIQLLQKNENLKAIRQEKAILMCKFEGIIDEINMLAGKLKQSIPQAKLKNLPMPKNDKPETSSYSKKENVSHTAYHTSSHSVKEKQSSNAELLRLQKELEMIESRLGKLAK